MDDDRRTTFAQHLQGTLTGAAVAPLIGLGHRLGLFEAAALGPATSDELAARTGLQERYVREWLATMATGGILDLDPDGRFVLPPEHAPLLTGERAANVAPSASMLQAMVAALPELERCFVDGGGVAFDRFAEHLAAVGAVPGDTWRRVYDEQLVDGFLGAVPGLTDRLRAGVDVLDLGCGTGHAVNVAAAAFPRSRFTGLDQQPAVIARAEAERAELGLPNAAFVVGDATRLPPRPGYHVVLAFDAVHDQRRPLQVLRNVRAALAPDGVFVMVDTKFATQVRDNLGSPHAALGYAISLMFCTTTSLAEDGAALGAMWGIERATDLLAEAGFAAVEVLDSPRPQNCIFVCRGSA